MIFPFSTCSAPPMPISFLPLLLPLFIPLVRTPSTPPLSRHSRQTPSTGPSFRSPRGLAWRCSASLPIQRGNGLHLFGCTASCLAGAHSLHVLSFSSPHTPRSHHSSYSGTYSSSPSKFLFFRFAPFFSSLLMVRSLVLPMC